MNNKLEHKGIYILMLLTVLFFLFSSSDANAAINNDSMLMRIEEQYINAATGWKNVVTAAASRLFLALATISFVWTFGTMALRRADIAEVFAELIRFAVFTGFFWWILQNGPEFSMDIINSLKKIGAEAANTSVTTPTSVVDMGFDTFGKILTASEDRGPVAKFSGIVIGLAFLILLCLIAVNLFILQISFWILAYAGVFFLGFGGSRWTSDIAINYYKTVLGVAAQMMTMILLIGIGYSFVESYYSAVSDAFTIGEMSVLLIAALALLVLVNKVPPMVGGLVNGGGVGALGVGFSAGAAIGAGVATVANAGGAVMSLKKGSQGIADAIKTAHSTALKDYQMKTTGGSDSDKTSSPLSKAVGEGANMSVMAGTMKNLWSGAKEATKDNLRETTVGGRIASKIEAKAEARKEAKAESDNSKNSQGNSVGGSKNDSKEANQSTETKPTSASTASPMANASSTSSKNDAAGTMKPVSPDQPNSEKQSALSKIKEAYKEVKKDDLKESTFGGKMSKAIEKLGKPDQPQ